MLASTRAHVDTLASTRHMYPEIGEVILDMFSICAESAYYIYMHILVDAFEVLQRGCSCC